MNNNMMNNMFFNNNNIINNNKIIINNNNMNTQQQLAQMKNSTKLKDIFPKTSKKGIDNLGATCFRNAVLSVFNQFPELVEYFINHNFDEKNFLNKPKQQNRL